MESLHGENLEQRALFLTGLKADRGKALAEAAPSRLMGLGAAWGSLEPMVAPGWRKPGELAAFLVLRSGGDIGMNQAAANFGFSLCSHG